MNDVGCISGYFLCCKSRCGFTLLELLVVVMLIALLSAVGLSGVSNLTQIQGRKGAVASLISGIRLAQTYAVTNDGNVRIVFATDDPAFSGAFESYKNAAFILMHYTQELDSNGKPLVDSNNNPLPPKWLPLTSWTRLPTGVIFSASQTEIFKPMYRQAMSFIEFDEMGGVKQPSIGDIDIFIRDVRDTSPVIAEQLRVNEFTGSVFYLSRDEISVIDQQ